MERVRNKKPCSFYIPKMATRAIKTRKKDSLEVHEHMEDNETVLQENGTEEVQAERTFTQAEVDSIVNDRLWRERAKYKDYDANKEKARMYDEAQEASKSELQKANDRANSLQTELDALKKEREISEIRASVAAETGVPVHMLTFDNVEDCEKQAKDILAFKGDTPYPSVQDGGENLKTQKKTDVEQFAEWFGAQGL